MVTPVLLNVKPLSDISRQIPCYFPLSCFISFPFIIVLQRCSKLICIKVLYYAIIYGKLQIPAVSKDRLGMPGCVQTSGLLKTSGQLWRETPDRPLAQFWECLDAPRVDSLWKEPMWWLCVTSHIAQEALSPHQGSLSASLMLLSCTKLQTTNPTGSYAPRTRLSLNFPQEMQKNPVDSSSA